MSVFTHPIPNYISSNSNKCIVFIVSNGFDERNIKVVQDVVITMIKRNPSAQFAVYSQIEKITDTIKGYLKIFRVKDYIFIYPGNKKPKSDYEKLQERASYLTDTRREYSGHNVISPLDYPQLSYGKSNRRDVFHAINFKEEIYKTLFNYKMVIGIRHKYNIGSVLVFTDNPRGTEVNELLKSALEYKFSLITVDSDGNFENRTNPSDVVKVYGGIYRNEKSKRKN